MTEFTPVASGIGGVLIGLGAALLLWTHGRIAGISGIVGNLLSVARSSERHWRVAFTLGLLVTGLVFGLLAPAQFRFELDRSLAALVVAGLLVGFGTRLGNGCTSGHGVCGISRLSVRSMVATLSFIMAGGVTVYVVQQVFGGAL